MDTPQLVRSARDAIAAGLLFLWAGGATPAPPVRQGTAPADYSAVRREGARLIEQAMHDQGVVGLSLALVDDQSVVWTQGFGYADQAHGVPATPATLYRVGSISKLFTATAVMQLAEQGRLRLDDPLTRHLPEFQIESSYGPIADLTLRRLLTHHSGLPANLIKGMWGQDPVPAADLIAGLRDEAMAYPAGQVFYYSNAGLALVGLAVERVGGESFPDWMQRRLLAPLAMRQSAFMIAVPDSPLTARGYQGGRESADPPLRDIAAGGLVSNCLDLSRFLRMVFADGRAADGRRILKAESLAEMLRPQNRGLPLDADLRVGLAWMLSGVAIPGAGTVVHHAGATLRYSAQLVALPAHKLGIVVLTNSGDGGDTAARLATQVLTLALRAKTGAAVPQVAAASGDGSRLTAAGRAPYLGYWTTEIGLVDIRDGGGRLRAAALGKTLTLEPRADGRLGVHYRWLGLVPVDLGEIGQVGLSLKRIGGQDALLLHQGTEDLLLGTRLSPTPIPTAWRARTGDYALVNQGRDYPLLSAVRLREQHGVLVVEIESEGETGQVALQPLDNRQAVLAGKVAGFGERVTVQGRDGAELLRYSGYLFRKTGRR